LSEGKKYRGGNVGTRIEDPWIQGRINKGDKKKTTKKGTIKFTHQQMHSLLNLINFKNLSSLIKSAFVGG